MTDKIKNLSEHRNKKKPRSLEKTSKIMTRRFSELTPDDIDEPIGFASGDPKKALNDKEEEDNNEG